MYEMILIVDFGSQVSHLISRRLRSLGVKTELVSPSLKAEKAAKAQGIILSGGPKSVYDRDAFRMKRSILELGIPVLGICYGHQLLAKMLGGKVAPAEKEYGKEILSAGKSRLFRGLRKKERVWTSHGDSVLGSPEGFKVIGHTESCRIAAFENEKKRIYGVQFHPEVHHTVNGRRILANFASICGAGKDYSLKGMDKTLVEEIKRTVGNGTVIMAVSGGVDSLVASVLIRKATPRVHCVFVDNGLLRLNETEEVAGLYRRLKFEHFHVVKASGLFLGRLKGVADPERKRKIIGKTFVELFEKKAGQLKKSNTIEFLGQGTIYPDRIESAKSSKQATLIKTHHNVGGLPDKMKMKLVEPLRRLYKDEVRKLGKILGIEERMLNRHPFPGPGLGIRVIGRVTPEKIQILQKADAIFIDELRKGGYYEKTWQAFAAILPGKAVGVMGDARAYGYIVSLRAVSSQDAMTADWTRLPEWLLEKVSNRIIKKVKGVTRVVYDVTQKPPATIEYE